MAERILDLQHYLFVVDERPVCVWDESIYSRNEKFLESIDPSYFEYLCRVHSQAIDTDREETNSEEQHAALALRTTYSQALETLFALIFASIQAPGCIPAWINAYKNHELKNLVWKVQEEELVISTLDAEKPSWSDIYDSIFPLSNMSDSEHSTSIKNGFTKAWRYFSYDFLSDSSAREYNSIKHGLRVSSGGFKMQIGIPNEPGSVPSPDKMVEVTTSKFGSSYLTSEKVSGQSHHVWLKRENRNWNIESLHWGIEILAMSIENIRTFLWAQMQQGETEAVFKIPSDLADFEKWKGFVNLTGPGISISSDLIQPFTKSEITERYKAKQYADVKRITFRENAGSRS